jgi:tetratricopeptide (TPR) repeat protein
MGIALNGLRRFSEAIDPLRQYLGIDSFGSERTGDTPAGLDEPEARYQLAVAYNMTGEYWRAIDQTKKILSQIGSDLTVEELELREGILYQACFADLRLFNFSDSNRFYLRNAVTDIETFLGSHHTLPGKLHCLRGFFYYLLQVWENGNNITTAKIALDYAIESGDLDIFGLDALIRIQNYEKRHHYQACFADLRLFNFSDSNRFYLRNAVTDIETFLGSHHTLPGKLHCLRGFFYYLLQVWENGNNITTAKIALDYAIESGDLDIFGLDALIRIQNYEKRHLFFFSKNLRHTFTMGASSDHVKSSWISRQRSRA